MADHPDTLLAALVRSSLNAIIVVDEAGLVVEFNPAAETIFGHSRAQAIGRSIGDLIVPQHLRAAHQAGMTRYMATGVPHVLNRRVEIEAMRASGEVFPVELSISEVITGDTRHFAASLRDLTRERAAEAARDDSEARLHAFMEHAPIGMYLKDGAGRYIMANPEFSRVFGRPLESILGRSADDLLEPSEAEMVQANDARVLATQKSEAVEEYLVGRDAYTWTLVLRFPLWSEGAQEWRIGGFDIDITPLKLAAAEVQRSQWALLQSEKLSALGKLLAGVAHELNNPLAVVKAQAEMLGMETEGTPLAARAARIGRAADRCVRIVQTFLALARQRPPVREVIRLNALVEQVIDLLAFQLRAAVITVRRNLVDGLPETTGDPDQIHQVVMNLALNAIQAMEALDPAVARTLTLTTGQSADGSLWLEVADSGPGVSEDQRGRIFEPFFTTKDQGKGTGMGLSFSRAMIEGHGGTLDVAPGAGGARFRLTLPRVETAATSDAKTVSAVPETGTGAALIVDDEIDVAEALADLMRVLGHRTEVRTSANGALAALAARDFDVILADLWMPDLDGTSFLEVLSATHPLAVPRLAFVTGDVLGSAAQESLRRAGRPVLAKPFDVESVRAILMALGPKVRG
ncbi:PAS domain S-box protein [Fertoebacter nigrum]|uniref:histidine kinase n=1 Tax=Fertoeibacter niger TaxID=2656921 RepID=A0A8X8KS97_9RHOB|nr:PAS domain S-box protein [Fertoeibacter niger]NUB46207.1 PAS domain S-box protein [Fertoeibacter niger]